MVKLSDNAVATPHWDEEGRLEYVRVETEYHGIAHHVNLEAAEIQALMRHTRAWEAKQTEASGAAAESEASRAE